MKALMTVGPGSSSPAPRSADDRADSGGAYLSPNRSHHNSHECSYVRSHILSTLCRPLVGCCHEFFLQNMMGRIFFF